MASITFHAPAPTRPSGGKFPVVSPTDRIPAAAAAVMSSAVSPTKRVSSFPNPSSAMPFRIMSGAGLAFSTSPMPTTDRKYPESPVAFSGLTGDCRLEAIPRATPFSVRASRTDTVPGKGKIPANSCSRKRALNSVSHSSSKRFHIFIQDSRMGSPITDSTCSRVTGGSPCRSATMFMVSLMA